MAIPLGDINFSGILLDGQAMAVALQQFVLQGSQRSRLEIADLDIISRTDPPPAAYHTVAEAIEGGTRLFDALAYFALPAAARPQPEYEALDGDDADPTMQEISSAVFFCYFWFLIRGSMPPHEQEEGMQGVPRFLARVMTLTKPQEGYVQDIASFDLRLIRHDWVRHIDLQQLDDPAKNRFALGIAGYRLAAPFAYMAIRDTASAEARTSALAVRAFLRRGLMWEVFSGLRSPRFLEVVKNFNCNLENLMMECFSDEDRDGLVARGALFALPTEHPEFAEYKTWTDATFAEFNDSIFGANPLNLPGLAPQ